MTKRNIKLSQWAEENAVSKLTAWRMIQDGRLIANRNPAGRYFITVDDGDPDRTVAIYARVSSTELKSDLDRQVARLATYAATNSLKIDKIVTEVGSGLNDHRRQLRYLLADPTVETILVERRDRLARFGLVYIEAAMAAADKKLVVMEAGEAEDDLIRDMIDLMTCFATRLYGRRSARNRAQRALDAFKIEA